MGAEVWINVTRARQGEAAAVEVRGPLPVDGADVERIEIDLTKAQETVDHWVRLAALH